MSWISFLSQQAKKQPDKTAIIDQNQSKSYSYDQINHLSNRWASFLKTNGVQKGDRVTLLCTNSSEHLLIFFGAAKLGAVFVPLNFRLANKELQKIVKKIDPKISFGFGPAPFPIGNTYIDLNALVLPETESAFDAESDASQALLMLFTSGSTGEPKGVILHEQMLLSNIENTIKSWGLCHSDITILETPFFHTGGYNVLCLPLLFLGGTVVLAKGFAAENVLNTIEKEKISVYFGVPTMFQMISEHPNFEITNFSSLRFFISGGAACGVELIKKYQQKGLMFKQGFGLTEVGPNCFLLEEKDAVRKAGSIGKPMPHSNVLVINSKGQVCGPQQAGELLIKGPHLCAGYFKDEKRFKDSLLDGYFKTGDQVLFDDEGFYYVVGRIKDMYISGGENVFPGEVEKELKTHAQIDEAVVVSVPDSKWGEVGWAFIQSNQKFDVDSIRNYLNLHLSRYKHPQYVENIQQWPLLPNGKIDRKKLKSLALSQFDSCLNLISTKDLDL